MVVEWDVHWKFYNRTCLFSVCGDHLIFSFFFLGTTSFLPPSSSSIFPSSPTFFLPHSAAHHATPVQNATIATASFHLSPSTTCSTSRQRRNVTAVAAKEDHYHQANAHLHHALLADQVLPPPPHLAERTTTTSASSSRGPSTSKNTRRGECTRRWKLHVILV